MKFSDLNLDASLQASIDKTGFTECTPIQCEAMPPILDGKDVAGLAQTGTGKTAAFLIPLMERILRAVPPPPDISEELKALIEKRAFKDWRPQNFILILVPTRELAEQVMDNIKKLGEASGLRGVAVYGGTSYDKQREAFRNGVEFVAATPGRLLDLYKEHLVDLKQVRAVVFDEADRMFDMGFKDDMSYILQRIPRERQYLVFSATLNFDVLNTAYQFGSEPVEVNISRDSAKADNVKDEIFHVGHEDKPQQLLSLLKKHNPKQAIIFTNYKFNVDRVAQFLSSNGVPAMGISSLLTQAQRTKVMDAFRAENDKNILVATDVAARGLDIKGVDLVVNYEMPNDPESYVHRIGRTGRAGAMGQAYSLVSDRDVDSLMRVEEYLKHKLEVGFLEDTDLIKGFRPLPYGEVSPGRVLNEAFNEGRPPRSSSGGGRSGPRRDGRGPREGGRHEGGRHEGGRPSGPRAEGPRSEGVRNEGSRNEGSRNEGGRGPRSRGPRQDGPRRDGPNAPTGEVRADGTPGEARPAGSGSRGPRRPDNRGRNDSSRGPRHEGGRHEGGRPAAPREGASPSSARPPRAGQDGRRAPPRPAIKKVPAPTLGTKVKSLFKKLFS